MSYEDVLALPRHARVFLYHLHGRKAAGTEVRSMQRMCAVVGIAGS